MLRDRSTSHETGCAVDEGVVIAAGVLLLGWSVLAGRLTRADLSGPILFVVAGLVLANGAWAPLDVAIDNSSAHLLAEATLALLLFADASRVDLRRLRQDAGLPLRLLLIGLPLAFAAGSAVALGLLLDLPWQLGALIGAALAPTDAALSAAVVADEQVPRRVRRALNVESGLNDGLAAPVVTFLIAAAAVHLGTADEAESVAAKVPDALAELGLGVALGVAIGWIGGRLIDLGTTRGWTTPGGNRIAAITLPVLALAGGAAIGANVFIAAFVAGLAFGATCHANADEEVAELPELMGEILSLVVWMLFGASLLLPGLEDVDWRVVVVAVASLTVVRMVPVALALVGAGVDRATTVFLGWFGPRGLASVVFLLLAAEGLPEDDPGVRTVVATITLTVLLSVVAHGVSARPLSGWLARRCGEEAGGDMPGEPPRMPRMHHLADPDDD